MAFAYARRPAAAVLALVLTQACGDACATDDYVQLYRTEPKAPAYTDQEIADLKRLGAILVNEGANFCVYSEHATRIELALFDNPETSLPVRSFAMQRFGDAWNLYVEGVGLGTYYGFIAWGPNWPYTPEFYPGSILGYGADVDQAGNRYNPNKLLIDPYARAYHRDHDWLQGSVASGPKRTESTYAAASKSWLVQSQYVWSDAEAVWQANRKNADWPGHRFTDLVLYEVHVKGFTADTSSKVLHPGTYRGFAEKADYLADLGVNAVELMPVFEKPLDGGYWGYQTLLFFAPEVKYATQVAQSEPAGVIDEFKAMVDVLHQHGIEVILDVVYNHTGEGGFWREKIELTDQALDPYTNAQLINFDPKEVAGIYSFRGFDNQAYYALSPDNQTYWNNTGVGNQSRANHRPWKKLILDSLHYWVEEMHVDGFRFDLAPILGVKDGDYNAWDNPANTVLQEIVDDPLLQAKNIRIIAEPWALGPQGYQLGGFPKASARDDYAFGEWNGNFRDWWRSFVNIDGWSLSSAEGPVDGGGTLTGSFGIFNRSGRRPYHSVNFVTVHDGFTLYDLFSYNQKVNSCGPLNPVCCSSPTSPFCNRDDGESNNRSRDWGMSLEHFKRQQMRNLLVATLISHGTPLLLGGDEWLRTQLGNNNAYSDGADNANNWFAWGTWESYSERRRMHDFVRQMIKLRKEHAYAFAPATYSGAAPFTWKNDQNLSMSGGDWSAKHVAMHYDDPSRGPRLFVIINMESASVTFSLPGGVAWRRLVDTQWYFDEVLANGDPGMRGYFADHPEADLGTSANITLASPAAIPGATYTVPAYTIVILEG
ncbi:MAG: glycosyl hydrolase [Deltaproteobacteria bacterium]|nr:glycosyl hydrolase [Deltaproteobacteria bacterium]